MERKRKRTVSYSSNSGPDTTDDTPVTPVVAAPVTSEPVVKRKRGRPRKTEAEKALAARKRDLRIKYKGVGRGRYPRTKRKTGPKRATSIPNEQTTNETDQVSSSPFMKDDLQRPLQVVMDPDNHTKMKFVSLKLKAKLVQIKEEPVSGKRKRKTKHLGPVSPSQQENVENLANCEDFNTPTIKTEYDDVAGVGHQQIKVSLLVPRPVQQSFKMRMKVS